jgi:site-specific DNA-methyltransferase (adenine-specific)
MHSNKTLKERMKTKVKEMRNRKPNNYISEYQRLGEGLSEYENRIIEADLFDAMSGIPDNSIDMVFIDPPYNLKKAYSKYNDNLSQDEYVDWCNRWLSECIRVLTPMGSLFVINIPKFLTYYACHLNKIAIFRHWIAWDALGSPTNSKLLPAHYGILWYTKTDQCKFNSVRIPHTRDKDGNLLADWGGKKAMLHPYGTVVSDVWTDIHRIRHKVRRDAHPCQLPPHLIERLILMTTDEGDIVLDPMVGAGTTAIAAKRMGRRYIGIDLDPDYVKITKDNLEYTEPTKIDGVYASIYLNKVISIRDKDYKKIEPFLKPVELKVNGHKTIEMRLPIIAKKTSS